MKHCFKYILHSTYQQQCTGNKSSIENVHWVCRLPEYVLKDWNYENAPQFRKASHYFIEYRVKF